MRVVLVHGFNVTDKGRRSVDRLAEYFPKDWDVDRDGADYGFFGLAAVRFPSPKRRGAIQRIAKALENADAVVAHSNGGNFVLKALRRVKREKEISVFFLSPAANRTSEFSKAVDKAFIYFTQRDFWVFLSGFLAFHPWGWMGLKGAKTEDPRVINRDCTNIVYSHSGWFNQANAPFFAAQIEYELENKNVQNDSQ